MAIPTKPLRLRLLTAALVTGLGVASCSSGNKRDNTLGLTKKEYLGVYLENAFRYLELGEGDRAIGQAAKALELDPDNELFRLIFARGHLMRGEADSIQIALDIFEGMDNIGDYRVPMTWGAAIERKGIIYDEASEEIRAGRRGTNAPDPIARADELRAQALQFWADAQEKYKESLALRSGEPEAINGLVRTSALLGNFEESITWGRELIDAIHSSQRLVSSQLDTPDMTEAREMTLFKSQRANRDLEVAARLHISTLERNLGRLADAVDELDAIIALDPNLEEAYSRKGQLQFELGEYRKAKESINRFIQLKAQSKATSYQDPVILQAYELVERCDRKLRQARR